MKKLFYGILAIIYLSLNACSKNDIEEVTYNNPIIGKWEMTEVHVTIVKAGTSQHILDTGSSISIIFEFNKNGKGRTIDDTNGNPTWTYEIIDNKLRFWDYSYFWDISILTKDKMELKYKKEYFDDRFRQQVEEYQTMYLKKLNK